MRLIVLLLSMIAGSALAEDFASYQVAPIGRIQIEGDHARIVLQPEYQDGLLGLEQFSHVWVIWWFDRNDTPEQRQILQVHPRANRQNPLAGVFATRAPVRPNPVALTLCRIVALEGNVLEVDGIDAFEGTPVIDLKPYIPSESVSDVEYPRRY